MSTLPAGGLLPEAPWARRHRIISGLLWAHVPVILGAGLVTDDGALHALAEAAIVAIAAAIASRRSAARETRTMASALGWVSASLILIHLSNGLIEMHFHLFVTVGVVALYQRWSPLLISVAMVGIHHATLGALAPRAVFNHPAAWRDPWTWAAIHAGFTVAAAVVSIALWKFDETSRLRAEIGVRQAEGSARRLQALVQNSSDAIGVMDDSGRLTFVSPAVRSVGGWTPEEVIGTSGLGYVHPDDRETAANALSRLVHAGEDEVVRLEFRSRRKGGGWMWVEARGMNRMHDPAIRGLVINYHDITERKDAERKQRDLEAQLRQSQKMEAVGRLAGGIAHDFNNLLSVILNYSAFLKTELRPEDPRRGEVSEIEKAGIRGARLIKQLLSFSRNEVLEPEVIDLNRVLGDMEELVRRSLGEDVSFDLEPGAELWAVEGDASQLEQVILNLVVNARDAMPSGGKLSIQTSNVLVDESTLDLAPELDPGPYIVLCVSDSGVGMSEEVRSHIFEPFFTTKNKETGTGLGLSIVYGIVKGSGGTVKVRSTLGEGTSFKVYLPATSATPRSAAEPRSIDISSGGERVLVVEDDDAVRGLVVRGLARAGYDVLDADSAEAALATIERVGRFDLLLTDVVMRGMSGRELAETASASGMIGEALFMSGYNQDVVTSRGLVAPDVRLLLKPFSMDDLLAAVREVLAPRARSRRDARGEPD